MRIIVQVVLWPLPWGLRRALLQLLTGAEIHPTASIGCSVILADSILMKEGSSILHFTIVGGLRRLELHEHAAIGSFNRIYATPLDSKFFQDAGDRDPSMVMEAHSHMVSQHIIDCSGGVRIGTYALIAGHRSQIITHGIDLVKNRQDADPVTIGAYSMIGTGCIVLPGSRLAPHSVLAAGSTLLGAADKEHTIYAGEVASEIGTISEDAAFFHRRNGVVY